MMIVGVVKVKEGKGTNVKIKECTYVKLYSVCDLAAAKREK